MSDTTLDLEEVRKSLSDFSPIYRKYIERALDEEDILKIQEIGYSMSGERPPSGFIISLSSPTQKNSLWAKVLDEVYEFFCTSSKSYKEERSKASLTFHGLVTVISSSLASMFNVSIGILSGLVAIALILVTKMGKNAWCKVHKERSS